MKQDQDHKVHYDYTVCEVWIDGNYHFDEARRAKLSPSTRLSKCVYNTKHPGQTIRAT